MLATKEHSSTTLGKKIPDSLIYEVMDGKPLYRKGYKEVLAKKKKIEDIIGTSGLQSLIISYIVRELFLKIDLARYEVLFNELGIHLEKNDNLAGDINIFDANVLTAEEINKHYVKVAPKIVIEVDISIDVENQKDLDYIDKKTQKLHDFGVEKVIWIFTEMKSVLVATPNQPWQIIRWYNDIEVFNAVKINIASFLKQKGIDI
jgi:Uma2 family endonuclease